MSLTLVLLGLGAAGAAAVGVKNYLIARQNREWGEVAEALALRYLPANYFRFGYLVGNVGPFRVSVWVERTQHGKTSEVRTHLEVDSNGRIPASLSLERQTLLDAFTAALSFGDLPVGDEDFDGCVRVEGERAQVFAALSSKARPAVRGLVEELRGEVKRGLVRGRLPGVARGARLRRALESMLETADLLSVGFGQLEERLVQNLETERVSKARLALFELIVGGQVSEELVERTISRALGHTDPHLRLAAARRAGARAVALKIARNRSLDDALRAEAIGLVSELPSGAAREDALALLERTPGPGESRGEDGPRAIAALAAWAGALGLAEAEPRLVELLAHSAVEVRIAAAGALGRVGSIHAVAPLMEAERGLLVPRDLKRAAQGAIAAIQTRLGAHAAAGQLSLAEPTAGTGHLSLALGERGALSTAVGEPGALSRPADGPRALPVDEATPTEPNAPADLPLDEAG